MTEADTHISDSRAIQGYLYFLFIYCMHYIIRDDTEIAFGKRHDPGQITYLIQKTTDNIILQDKN